MKSKTFKRFGSAVAYAKQNGVTFILKAGDFYIVQDTKSCTEFAVLEQSETEVAGNTFESWPYVGHVGRDHLARLGNANWAHAGMPGGTGACDNTIGLLRRQAS